MSGDQALGFVALSIGLALLLLQARIARVFAEREEEELRKPLHRAMTDYWEARVPRWMRGPTFGRRVNRLWLTVVGAMFVYAGIRLLAG
jgi:CO dehydrogenase/acetyl-CoA synthase delta subunit